MCLLEQHRLRPTDTSRMVKIIWYAEGFAARISEASSERAVREEGDSMRDNKSISWEEIFLKTMEEKDSEILAQLVPQAESAIFERQRELDNCAQHSEELSAMCVASEALRVVKHSNTTPKDQEPSMGNAARFAKFARRSGTAEEDGRSAKVSSRLREGVGPAVGSGSSRNP
jgi:hypothetical protein